MVKWVLPVVLLVLLGCGSSGGSGSNQVLTRDVKFRVTRWGGARSVVIVAHTFKNGGWSLDDSGTLVYPSTEYTLHFPVTTDQQAYNANFYVGTSGNGFLYGIDITNIGAGQDTVLLENPVN